jgi:hypothetical protein
MQLDTQRIQTINAAGRLVVSFNVLRDGVVVDNAPTQSVAWERMDALWIARPEADRELERQYTGR